jgi:methylisocitrate lyase
MRGCDEGVRGRGDFVICARTDAKGVEGFDAAVARAKAYVAAGADMIFPEGLTSEDEFKKFADAILSASSGTYLLANMTEFGKTPLIPLAKFGAMGYACVIYPVSLLRVAMGAVDRALSQLKNDGSVEGFIGQMQTRQQLYDLVEYKPGVAWEFRA